MKATGRTSLILAIILVVFVGGLLLLRSSHDDIKLPKGGSSETETVLIQDGDVLGILGENTPLSQNTDIAGPDSGSNQVITTKEIMVTNGVRHSVPLEDILSGGPPKDGIPSIDDPSFVPINEAEEYLDDAEPGIAFSDGSTHRFYPFQILVWHEIVNDTIDNRRILITYCPLCLSGIVFDPMVDGSSVEFGTSGRLWNSNLVMYDRKTDSLWSQVLGEAIVGDMTGTRLDVLPSDQIRFGEWKQANPDGEVLSRDTGAIRFYGQDPYGDYYTTPGIFFPVDKEDSRLPQKTFVLGLVINDQAKAYDPEAIRKKGEVRDVFQGVSLVLRHEKDIDAIRIFKEGKDDKLERINPFGNFWFSWVAAHPGTELYK